MADRDSHILRRLADARAADLLAAATSSRRPAGNTAAWRRAAGDVLVRLGEALAGDRRDQLPLRPASAPR